MTPRSIFTIIILAVTLCIGGALGYFIGNHKAQAVEKQLSHDQMVGKVQDVTHDQLVAQLKAQNEQTQKDFDAYKAQNEAKAAAAEAQWKQTIAQKDAALAVALKNSGKAQVQVTDLKAQLFLATTPEEKAALQKQLDAAQSQLAQLQARADGLKCLDVPIPQEYIDAVNATVGDK